MNLRLYNAKILTMEENKAIFHGEIWVKDERIVYIGCDESGKQDLSEEKGCDMVWDCQIDCENNLLMPGFKNAHTHSGMTLLRSYADDLPLQEWLEQKVFPTEAKLTGEDIYHFTRLAILEYLSSGITGIFDMYLTPDTVAKACIDMGMRCVLVSGLNDFTSSIEQQEQEYEKWNQAHSLIRYQLGCHAEYTCSKELLVKLSGLAHKYKAPVYMHLAETEREVMACLERYGMTPAVFFDSLGMFDYGGGGFHCIHMTEEDINVFRKRGLYVVTNPASNLKLASGVAPIKEYQEKNISVAIGTDGPASNNCLDMFREMFLVAGLSNLRERDASSINALKVLHMATVNGSKTMGLNDADVLAAGKLADIIMIDLQKPNMQPIHNIEKNIVYSGSKSNVKMTMIAGRILYYDGQYIGQRADSIYDTCEKIVRRLEL